MTFNDNVRVKTIASRKNTPAERKELMKRLSGGAATPDEEDEDDDDDEEEGMDWNMEKFDDAEGAIWEDELGDEDGDDDEEDPDATESDTDADDQEGEEVGIETIQRLKNDLFDDEEDEDNNNDTGKLRIPHLDLLSLTMRSSIISLATKLSTHAKRLQALSSEISAFETENVSKKDWTLMGEANSRSRPKNSLLEEDLEFERSGGARAAPVVTEERTTSLEGMIKKRILDVSASSRKFSGLNIFIDDVPKLLTRLIHDLQAQFDDVVRRQPISDESPFLPSKLFELDGNKSSKSLAQLYEDDYTAARDGDGVVIDDRDGKLAKEHEELEKMWNAISYKLDALSNAHFTPKQVRLLSFVMR